MVETFTQTYKGCVIFEKEGAAFFILLSISILVIFIEMIARHGLRLTLNVKTIDDNFQ